MTPDHPITPPPELIKQLAVSSRSWTEAVIDYYRAGADHELEACCDWLERNYDDWDNRFSHELRAARRPKPPSLKEQALRALDSFEGFTGSLEEVDTIRRALEQLDD